MSETYRLGVDIGGTFTDAMLVGETDGSVRIAKVPSTPSDPSIGFLNAVDRIIGDAGVDPSQVTYVAHGTTVATNAVIEGKGAPTGFITTEGFRDLLEIQRQIRPKLYDIKFEKPAPLVPRYLAHEVAGRIDAHGNEITPLSEESVRKAIAVLKDEGVESIAVCFLHSYVNADHEERAAAIIRDEFPEAHVSLSSTVAPEIREYFRASTTVINALVQPVVKRYLNAIEDRMRKMGFDSQFLLMQSNGGVLTFAAASERPVFMIESGPAAGVNAAKHVGDLIGERNVIAFDMGGTTAKTGMILNGESSVTKEFEVGTIAGADQRGAGYPIRTPVIELVEVGAGGGSLAWVDPGGILRVGPESAGADPGPACYGVGGTLPTVTDANVVLGRLDPDHFLSGEMRLDVDASREAIRKHCAEPLGMSVVECAHAIVELANITMVNALRLVSVQRGYDPREFVLVSFGGGGPAHATRLATALGSELTVIPPSPGVLNAKGLLVTDLVSDAARTHIRPIDEIDSAAAETIYEELAAVASAQLDADAAARPTIHRQLELRYIGQSHALPVTLPSEPFSKTIIDAAVTQFHAEHERAYGYAAPEAPVEIVTLKASAVGDINRPEPAQLDPASADSVETATLKTGKVYFQQAGDYVDTPVIGRQGLGSGARFHGPALIVELDSTTLVEPGWEVEVDNLGNLLMRPPAQ